MKKQTDNGWLRNARVFWATAMAVVLFTGISVQARDIYWDDGGADHEWNTAQNWDVDQVPNQQDTDRTIVEGSVGTGDTRPVINNVAEAYALHVGGRQSSIGIQGELDINNDLTMSGGSKGHFTLSDHLGSNYNEPSTVNHSAGHLNVGAGYLYIGLREGNGVYNMTGGSTNVRLKLGHDGGDGTMNVSGGTLDARAGAEVFSTSTFHVKGSGSTIETNTAGVGGSDAQGPHWNQTADATLKISIDDTSTGVSPIQVLNGGGAKFETGAELDVSFLDGVSHSEDTEFEIMNWGGDLMNNAGDVITSETDANNLLGFADSVIETNWQKNWYGLDGNDDGGSLSVTYVPEPSSMLLLGLAGLLLMKRRRL